MTDHIRDMYETMYQIAEIKKISNQFQTSFASTDQLSYIISILSMQQSRNSNTRLEWLKDYASLGILDNMLRKTLDFEVIYAIIVFIVGLIQCIATEKI